MQQKQQNKQTISISALEELHTSGAGYDILRYMCLPEIFGSEKDTLLYMTGRNLARKFDIQSIEDISYIFKKLGWGTLELSKETKKNMVFHLLDDAVVYRLMAPFDADFRLEAGFLSQAVQLISARDCECAEEVHSNIHQVEFNVFYTT